jgi:sec-independent protein translocase protein TatC
MTSEIGSADKEKRLSILGHLNELRIRLTRSVIAIAIATGIAFAFANQIFGLLTYKSTLVKPAFDFLTTKAHLFAPPNINLIYIDITEMVGVYMKVCLISGIILSMPYLLYEAIMFVAPALTKAERRRFIYTGLPFVGGMFLVGVLFAYFVLLPPALRFLTTFGSDIATPQIRIGNYLSIVSRLLLAVGAIFEMPVVISVLSWMGIVSYKWLSGKRKWAAIIAFLVGAIVTPTLDPVNQTLVSLPIILLYELSIWLSWIIGRRKKKAAATGTD